MKKLSVILTFLFTGFLFAGSGGVENNSEPGEQFISIAKSVLEAESLDKIQNLIFPEAYVVLDGNYESIFEVFGSTEKKEKFIEGKDIEIGTAHIRITDDEKNAYMVLETKNGGASTWHTIFFHLNKDNNWQVLSWHKS